MLKAIEKLFDTYEYRNKRAWRCRLCRSWRMRNVLNFGNLAISTFIEQENDNIGHCPLVLDECRNCSMVQLRHTAPQELLYSGMYWYKSGINPKIVNDLKQIVREVENEVQIGDDDVVLDIGANDGTLLSFYRNGVKVGCEPATNLRAELQQKAHIVLPGLWNAGLYNVCVWKKAKAITAIGMFYDLERPLEFMRHVKEVLTDDGIFVAQLMTLEPMLKKRDIGNICHEHIEYYTYKSLVYLYEKAGLEIYRVEENDINGGSYRIFARHYTCGSIEYLEASPNFKQFETRVTENIKDLETFLKREKAHGKKIYGYGASTKGNTLLQLFENAHELFDGIADKNPVKVGKLTVATHIPIVSEAVARKYADYFVVLPWGFLDVFRKREKRFLEKGGAIVTCTPSFTIIRKDTYES